MRMGVCGLRGAQVPEWRGRDECLGPAGGFQCREAVEPESGVGKLGGAGLLLPSQVTCRQAGEELQEVQREGGSSGKGQGRGGRLEDSAG